jgi:hypothetical protein
MPGLLRFSKVLEGPASPLWGMVTTPFALMQQCRLTVGDCRVCDGKSSNSTGDPCAG